MSQYTATPEITLDAAEALAKHRLARLDSSGDAVYCDAGEFPKGTVGKYTASGDPVTVCMTVGRNGTMKCVAAIAISALDDVYTAADGKVSTVNTGVYVGKARTAASGDGSVVEVYPDVRRCVMVNTAASAAIGSSSTAAAAFDKSFNIPASELKAGSVIRVKASGLVLDQDSTPQLDVRLLAGTEVIATATVAQAADNDQWNIEAEIVIRTIGASGTLIAQTKDANDAAATGALYVNKASAVEDMSAGLTISLTGQFGASHADNTTRLDLLMVEHLR